MLKLAGLGRRGNLKCFLELRELKPKLVVRDLAPSLWPALETLFGPRGACGGCWCMYWRLEKGERWEDLQGAPAKRRMKALVACGQGAGRDRVRGRRAGRLDRLWAATGFSAARSGADTRLRRRGASLVAPLLLHQGGLAGSRRRDGAPAPFASLTAAAGREDRRGLSGEPEARAAIAACLCLDGHAFAFLGCGV